MAAYNDLKECPTDEEEEKAQKPPVVDCRQPRKPDTDEDKEQEDLPSNAEPIRSIQHVTETLDGRVGSRDVHNDHQLSAARAPRSVWLFRQGDSTRTRRLGPATGC